MRPSFLLLAVRLAKVQRYNRILERRNCNHAIIREHQLLHEFFTIAKVSKRRSRRVCERRVRL